MIGIEAVEDKLVSLVVRSAQKEMFRRCTDASAKSMVPVTVHDFGAWVNFPEAVFPTLPGCYEIGYFSTTGEEVRPMYFGQSVNLNQRLLGYRRGVFDNKVENVKQQTMTRLAGGKVMCVRWVVLSNLIEDREPIPALRSDFPTEKKVLDFVEKCVLAMVNYPLNAIHNGGYRPSSARVLPMPPLVEVREDFRLLSRLIGHVRKGKLVPFL